MNGGWIRLDRKLLEHQLWLREPFTWGQAWVDLLMRANFKDGSVLRGYREVPVLRGQVFTSQLELARRWRWDRKTVRRFIDALKRLSMVDIETSKDTDTGYTKITIHNYELYQGQADPAWDIERGNARDIARDNASPSSSPSLPHFQEGKEGNKDKKTTTPAPSARGSLIDCYSDLFEARYGRKPHNTRGKDGQILKALLADQAEETVRERLRLYLADSDPFFVKTGHSLGVFASRFNGIANGNGHHVRQSINDAWKGQKAGVVELPR